MDEGVRASLQGVTVNYRQRLDELRRMQRDVRAVSATARTRDGVVRVDVGPNGELRDIRLEPRVYDRMDPQQLAHTIMRLIGEATEEAAGRAREITAAFLPEELAARLRGGEDDLTVFLPDAPSVSGAEEG
jgi:DNA-binding protein YbaB